MYFIYILYTVWDQGDISSLGPNFAVLFLSVVYLCLFEMFIYMFKAKTKKAIILYMTEDEEKSEVAEKIKISSVVKTIIGILISDKAYYPFKTFDVLSDIEVCVSDCYMGDWKKESRRKNRFSGSSDRKHA
mgnify:CR=1 FL=1